MNGRLLQITRNDVQLTPIACMEDLTDIIRTFPTTLLIIPCPANLLQAAGRASMAMEQKQPV